MPCSGLPLKQREELQGWVLVEVRTETQTSLGVKKLPKSRGVLGVVF